MYLRIDSLYRLKSVLHRRRNETRQTVVSAKQYARPTRHLDEVNNKIASVGDQSASHMTTVASVQTYISLSHTTSYLLTDHFSGAACR